MADQVVLTFSQTSASPADVLQFHCGPSPFIDTTTLQPGTVLVRQLASPINPQDLMVIAGRYPVKPSFSHAEQPIPGYDGVAHVLAVASDVTTLSPGDRVIPARHGLGTWRRFAVHSVSDFVKLPPGVDPVAASMLRMVFLPAYLLVEDMARLQPGDWIVQNAASGAIPNVVAQFARLRGVRVCSLTRGVELSETDAMQSLSLQDQDQAEVGSVPYHITITDAQLAAHGVAAHPALAAASAAGRIVLALDAVFGTPGERLASLLSKGGQHVVYGSLAGGESTISLNQKLLFWNEVRFRNFRLSAQLALRSQDQQDGLLAWFAEMLRDGRLTSPHVERLVVPKGSEGDGEWEEKVRSVVREGSAVRKCVLIWEGVCASCGHAG